MALIKRMINNFSAYEIMLLIETIFTSWMVLCYNHLFEDQVGLLITSSIIIISCVATFILDIYDNSHKIDNKNNIQETITIEYLIISMVIIKNIFTLILFILLMDELNINIIRIVFVIIILILSEIANIKNYAMMIHLKERTLR